MYSSGKRTGCYPVVFRVNGTEVRILPCQPINMKKDELILQKMIDRKIIPQEGIFEITSNMIDAFYNIYREVNPPKGKFEPSAGDLRYSRRLAGLSLMKLCLDRGKQYGQKPKCGVVYLISNPAFPGKYKIGITQDLYKRLSSYQTYDPYRQFKIEQSMFVPNMRLAEKQILEIFKTDIVKGEWIDSEQVRKIFILPF